MIIFCFSILELRPVTLFRSVGSSEEFYFRISTERKHIYASIPLKLSDPGLDFLLQSKIDTSITGTLHYFQGKMLILVARLYNDYRYGDEMGGCRG